MKQKSEKVILVVSFGTTHKNAIENNIGVIERYIAKQFPSFSNVRAFTSKVVLDKLKKTDGCKINNVETAIEVISKSGVDTVICQPTHIVPGYDYGMLVDELYQYSKYFKSFKVSNPLLNGVEDYTLVANVLAREISPQKNVALVLIGHGTEHSSNACYAALDYHFKEKGYKNIFVGTVESYPDVYTVLNQVKKAGFYKVILSPLMVVVGDHAMNDISGDNESSWESIFKREGFEVELVLKGLGEYKGIRDIYIKHLQEVIDTL